VAAAIGLPHRLRLEQAPPAFGATFWLAALLLRAVASLAAALAIEVYVPTTGAVASVTGWCAGQVSGHDVGDLVMALPAVVLAASLIAVLLGLWRAARRVDTLMRSSVVGEGPAGSLVIADAALLVAAGGLWRPRVLVSAGALMEFDDEELSASLAHEQGHIARRHRYVLVVAELARGVARLLPGTRAAARELVFHLERDADRYAVARSHDPAVLASAICKAARTQRPPAPPTLALGGGVVVRRLRQLLDGGAAAPPPHKGLVTLAPVMVALVAASAIALPFVAHATYHEAHERAVHVRCSV